MFSIHNYFFSIPILGPIVGAIVGVWIYVGYSSIIKNFGHISHPHQQNDHHHCENLSNLNETTNHQSLELKQNKKTINI